MGGYEKHKILDMEQASGLTVLAILCDLELRAMTYKEKNMHGLCKSRAGQRAACCTLSMRLATCYENT